MHRLILLSLIILSRLFFAEISLSDDKAKAANGRIHGLVTDIETGQTIPGATIRLMDKFGGAITDTSGMFTIKNLSVGNYSLQISHVGYETEYIDSIMVGNDESSSINVALAKRILSLKGITVTPSRFTIMGTEPMASQSLTREEMETIPQLGDDFFRAVSRLPGVGSNDFSAKFAVRGGEYDEILVTLDGLQIYEPFHLKDIDGGVAGIVDVSAVEEIDLLTGGFPAEYGDKMSGVFNIKSKVVSPEKSRFSLGISLMNFRMLAEGRFAKNRGSWLLSARRGYIDYVLKLAGADDEIKPTYYDIFGKVQYQLSRQHILAFDFLHAGDDLRYIGQDYDSGDSIITNYGNTYGWIVLQSSLFERLTGQTIVSVGKVNHERRGNIFIWSIQQPEYTAYDKKDFTFTGFQSNWELEISRDYLVKFGFDVRKLWADYDYLNQKYYYNYQTTEDSSYVDIAFIDTTRTMIDPTGNRVGTFISNRFRLFEPITIEAGMRYDYASYTGDELFSPRLNAVFSIGPRTTVRGGWGYFYQTEGIDEMFIGDGEVDFFPAEKAEHFVLGLEHIYDNGVQMRMEAYYKRYTDLRPDLRNSFDDITPFPELEGDRSFVCREKSTSKGIELYLKKDTGGKISWWTSYAFAKVEDKVNYIYFPQNDAYGFADWVMPSPNDQRHTLNLDMNYRPNHYWQINLAWQYHSGWPYTNAYLAEMEIEGGARQYYVQAGEQWGARHTSYSRIDLQVNRYFSVGRGRIIAFVGVINLLGTKNVRGYQYEILEINERYYLDKDPEHWFGRLPSFGVKYELDI